MIKTKTQKPELNRAIMIDRILEAEAARRPFRKAGPSIHGGFCAHDRNGVGCGHRRETLAEVQADMDASAKRQTDEFRGQLEAMSDEQLKSQFGFWCEPEKVRFEPLSSFKWGVYRASEKMGELRRDRQGGWRWASLSHARSNGRAWATLDEAKEYVRTILDA